MAEQELPEKNEIPEQTDQSEAAAPRRQAPPGLTLKVSAKGALSVYGLGRFPVTLYKEQWTRLLAAKGEIVAFLQANDGALKSKEK